MEICQKCLKYKENFRTFWPKWRFSEILTNIAIFFWNYWQNRQFWRKSSFAKIWPISRFLENFVQNRDFSKILTKIEFFRKFWLKSTHLRLVTAEYSRRPLGGGPTPTVPDHAMAWWREADAGWLLACRCRPGAGSTGCAGLNAARGVTTGCQRRPASGCADVDRDWDDRAVYSVEHVLPADVTIGIADPGLSEWRKVTCNVFSGFPTNFGSLSHQLSLSCRKPSLTCTAQLVGIGGSSFLSRKMRLSISFHLCLHFTQVSQIKALRSKLRFHVLIKILASFEFRALIQYKYVVLLV